jgi:hypothetical protein
MIPTINIETVVKGIYSYSWYPALHLLAKLEKKERFEDCAVIKNALDGLLHGRKNKLSTETDKESLDKTFEKIIHSSKSQEVLINNMQKYISDFEKLVCK